MRRRTSAARRSGRSDRGQVTILALGYCVALASLGLVVTDAWRAISAWRRVASVADAAAAAGASGVDEAAFRSSGGMVIELDPSRAEQLAYDSLATQQDRSDVRSSTATATAEEVTVVVHGRIDLSLLGVLRGGEPITMTVTATADPRPSP
jgi:hypothetical protein